MKKKMRQTYFVAKELRTSISLIILWSLLATAFFTYFAKELGEKIGSGILLFAIVSLGYVAIVVGLTMLFTHRLIGPFQRLNTEIRLIKAGDYRRRLNVRTNDDIYIRSFVTEINEMLEKFEELQHQKDGLVKHLDSELLCIISLNEDQNASKDKMRESVLACHKKLKTMADI